MPTTYPPSSNTTSNKTLSNATISNATDNITSNQTIIEIKPRLVLIIDDVVSKAQINRINKIPLKLTPSFLPPTAADTSSAKNIKFADFYMVHLPLEALNFDDEQGENRLFTTDTYEEIYNKLAKIKSEFPGAIFYNGHTGSKFTSDYEAMDRLFRAMEELGLIYVESKTIATAASLELAKKYHKKLLTRDIFLDHEVTEEFITKQIYLAVELAKKNGYAIAIGHPHKETLDLLESLSDDISKEVDVVYLKDLYYAKD